MKSLSNLNNILGALIFLFAYFVGYWVPELSERQFDTLWNFGLVLILFRRSEWVFILLSVFLRWRLLDELLGDPYTISWMDFVELFITLFLTILEYLSPIFSSFISYIRYEPHPAP